VQTVEIFFGYILMARDGKLEMSENWKTGKLDFWQTGKYRKTGKLAN
jgi:hypothetical protein